MNDIDFLPRAHLRKREVRSWLIRLLVTLIVLLIIVGVWRLMTFGDAVTDNRASHSIMPFHVASSCSTTLAEPKLACRSARCDSGRST